METIRRWSEFEDWAESYPRGRWARTAAGAYEATVNLGGPGAAVAYHFYARVRTGGETTVSGVSVADTAFVPDFSAIAVPGAPHGSAWVHLGFVKSGRAYRQVRLESPDALAGLDAVWVVEIPDRLLSGEIERRIARAVLGPEPLSGVPLGGIGAGKMELCGDGIFRNITVNGNIDTPLRRSEGSFFALRAEGPDGSALSRVLAVEPLFGMAPMERLSYDGRYPFAVLSGRDSRFPLSAEVEAFAPILPRNPKDSSLPCAFFRVRLTSRSDEPMKASVALAIENFLGRGGAVASRTGARATFDEGYYELWEERAGNTEAPWSNGPLSGVLYDGGAKSEPRSAGQYVLATDAPGPAVLRGWRLADGPCPWRAFEAAGAFPAAPAEPSAGEPTGAALAVSVPLAPGETREIRMVFAWHVPVFFQAPGPDYGHYHARFFSSAGETATYALQNFDRICAEAAAVPRLLADSTLPAWFSRSLCNDAYVMSTATWLTKDGRFAVNEGPTHMFGCMGTLDQKLYANHYAALFFPELDKTELLGFARSRGENGSVQHDLGYGHLEQTGRGHHWPDLSSALAILSLKHYQLTGDTAFIDEVYPHAKDALLRYQLSLDSDGDAIANISGVGNTFDAEKFEGTSSYIATLWLAALRALEEMARRRGDAATEARCRELFDRARASAVEQLWNGSFFVNYYDTAQKRRCPNSHFSQAAGELFGRLCGLGPLYGDHLVRQAIRSTIRLNWHGRLAFPTNEATPEGRMPDRKMWGWLPHSRVFLGALPCLFGMAEEGLDVLRRLDDVLRETNGDNRWDQRLFYEPDTGREHWGRFYMTAPATWYAYQALVGWFWDAPEGILGLAPNLPASLLPFDGPIFTPGFWARLRVDADRSRMRLSIVRRFDDGLTVRRLRVPAGPGVLAVRADGAEVPLSGPHPSPFEGVEEYGCAVGIDRAGEIEIVRAAA